MMFTRNYNILTHVTASKEVWDAVDEIILAIQKEDKNEEVCQIAISKSSLENGVFGSHCTVLAILKNRSVSRQLEEAVSSSLRIDWLWEELAPDDTVILWNRRE